MNMQNESESTPSARCTHSIPREEAKTDEHPALADDQPHTRLPSAGGDVCPECGGMLIPQSGRFTCVCWFSECR
jgi:hypothetical protein